MDDAEAKSIAERWLATGINGTAMRRYMQQALAAYDCAALLEIKGKDPNRSKEYAVKVARISGMAAILDLYLTEWMTKNDIQANFHRKEKVWLAAKTLCQ
jgi:hypothetical protein